MNQPNPYEAPASFIEEDPYGDDMQWGLPPLATRGSRLAASILDGILISIPMVVFAFIYTMLAEDTGTDSALFVAFMAIPVLAIGGYNLHLLHKNGQTLGKKLMNIKIVRGDRRTRAGLGRLVFFRIIPQWLVQGIPLIGGLLSIVDILFIFGSSRKCVHDRLADTVVIDNDGLGDLTDDGVSW